MGAVLAYRALYYLTPLAGGLLLHLLLVRLPPRPALPDALPAPGRDAA